MGCVAGWLAGAIGIKLISTQVVVEVGVELGKNCTRFTGLGIMMKLFSPSDSFSPESGGRVKPRTAMEAMSKQGTIRLKK